MEISADLIVHKELKKYLLMNKIENLRELKYVSDID
jgi:hypothetical protein